MNYTIKVNEEELCTIKTSLMLELERNYGKDENVTEMIQKALTAVDNFIPNKH